MAKNQVVYYLGPWGEKKEWGSWLGVENKPWGSV